MAATGQTESESDSDVQAFGEIIQKDADKQIVTGPVLIPGKPDRQGDIVSTDNIEKVAHDYLATHRLVDEMHDNVDRAEHSVVESFVAPQPIELGGEQIRKGSWIVSVQLGDDAWTKVESGEYSGFSIEGRGARSHSRGDS